MAIASIFNIVRQELASATLRHGSEAELELLVHIASEIVESILLHLQLHIDELQSGIAEAVALTQLDGHLAAVHDDLVGE